MATLNGERVAAKARQAGDTTHAAIARRLDLRQSTVSRLLSGVTAPSLTTMLAIRAAYGISLDELVLEDGETAHREAVAG